MDTLVFDLTRKEIPVSLSGKAYKLVELDGASRDEVLNDSFGRMKFGPDGKVIGMRDVKGLQATLVSRCIQDDAGKPVPINTVSSWRATVVEGLYKACQELNGLIDNDKAKEVAKNDSAAASEGTGTL